MLSDLEVVAVKKTAEAQVPRVDGLLDGKVAIITGASRGIGAATARAFRQAGASVVLAARDGDALADVAGEIEQAGGEALAVPTDVGDPTSVEALVRTTLSAFGRLDVAFNNAGDGHMPAPLAELEVMDFDRAVRVSLRGVFLSMRYKIPAMLEGGGGAIVNMSSEAGLTGVRGMGGYVAAKHGVIGLTRTAALDYAERGIRVNAVAPGPILTHRISALPDDQRAPIARTVPLGRLGDPAQVAATVVWLCSDLAGFVTGVTVPIDGGRLVQGGGRSHE